MTHLSKLLFFILALSLSACAITGSSPRQEKRNAVLAIKDQALTDLYKIKPDVKHQVANAVGYAVFSNVNLMAVFVSTGGGHGVVTNNKTGQQTYMKMRELGVGIGAGLKDYRAVFIFHNAASLKRFVDKGWLAGVSSDITVKASDKGGDLTGSVAADSVTIYQLTETGVAVQASLTGAKYWKNDELN